MLRQWLSTLSICSFLISGATVDPIEKSVTYYQVEIHSSNIFLSLFYLFIYWKVGVTERRREKKRDFPFAGSSLHGCSGQYWARLKPRTWIFIWFSFVLATASSTCILAHCLSQAISTDQERKLNSQNVIQCQCGLAALQGANLHTAAQCQLLKNIYLFENQRFAHISDRASIYKFIS